jgi:hypothetical protein
MKKELYVSIRKVLLYLLRRGAFFMSQNNNYILCYHSFSAVGNSYSVLPKTLAAVDTQGKLSSGSEMRNAYLVYMALKTNAIRSLLLQPLLEIKKINGWVGEVEFGFEDIEITKLDSNPTGSQTVMS